MHLSDLVYSKGELEAFRAEGRGFRFVDAEQVEGLRLTLLGLEEQRRYHSGAEPEAEPEPNPEPEPEPDPEPEPEPEPETPQGDTTGD